MEHNVTGSSSHVTPCSVMDLSQCLGLPLSLGIFTLILRAASSYKHWNLSTKMQCVFYNIIQPNTQIEAWNLCPQNGQGLLS